MVSSRVFCILLVGIAASRDWNKKNHDLNLFGEIQYFMWFVWKDAALDLASNHICAWDTLAACCGICYNKVTFSSLTAMGEGGISIPPA